MTAVIARLGLVVSILVASGGAPVAAPSTVWEVSTGEQFALGKLDGTALDVEGRIKLAPDARTLWGPDDGIVWAVDGDGGGGVFVALSNPARVVRIDSEGSTSWYSSDDDGALVTSLVADGAGGVWFGVAPDGHVVHATAPGVTETTVETGSVFVWALARVGDDLWIGTGVPGSLLRRAADGEIETMLDTADDPLRTIVESADGGVIAGTGGRGRVIGVGPRGRAFVLHDADEAEIVDLALGEDGEIYALAAASGVQLSSPGAPSGNRPVDATVRVTATPPAESASNGGEATPAPQNRSRPPRIQVAPGAALYRIGLDGYVARIWRSAREAPFSLAPSADGVVIGTGDDGRLIEIGPRGRTGRLMQLPSDQISAMRRLADGSLLVGATSDARVVSLGAKVRQSGTYASGPIDAGRAATWGRVSWIADLPRGAAIDASVRAGNTDTPDETWSDWVAVAEGDAPRGLPVTRWFQIRLDLRASRRGDSPSISAVRVHFRPRNRPPTINSIEIEPPGLVWTRPPAPANATRGPRVADDPVARRTMTDVGRPARAPTVRKAYEVGVRTVSWAAEDADRDRLVFDLDLRREGDVAWQPLARDVDDSFLSWDARAVGDGRYRVRVTARDARDNPFDEQLDAARVSSLFIVDTAAPTVGPPRFDRQDGRLKIRFHAVDTTGEIASAEMSVDGEPWRPLRPDDGVADAPFEWFTAQVPGAAGSLRVRVADAAGNLAGASWTPPE